MKRKRLNIPLVGGLFFGSVIFLVCVYFLHDYQVTRNADSLLRRATEARQAGDLEEAVRLRSRYLAHRKEEKDQYIELARDQRDLLMEMLQSGKRPTNRDFGRASGLIDKAVDENPDNREMRQEAVEFYRQFGAYDLAITHLKQLVNPPPQEGGSSADEFETRLAEWKEQSDPEMVMQLASLYLRVGKESESVWILEMLTGYDPTRQIFEKIKALDPGNVDAFQALASIRSRVEFDEEAAIATLNKMVEFNQDDHNAYVARALGMQSLRGKDALENAKADIENALAIAPQAVNALIVKSRFYANDSDFAAAEQCIRTALENPDITDNEATNCYIQLSQLAISQKETDRALTILDDSIKQFPAIPLLYWTKAQLLIDAERYDDVRDMQRRLREVGISDPQIKFLEARIDLAEGKTQDAVVKLEAARPLVDNETRLKIDFALMSGYGQLRRPDAQLQACENVLKVNPLFTPAMQAQVAALSSLRRAQEALNALNSHQQKLEAEALDVPAEFASLRTSLKVQLASTTTSESGNQWDDVNDEIRNLLASDVLDDVAKVTTAVSVLSRQERYDEAIRLVENSGIRKFPNELRFYNLRLGLAYTQKDEKRAAAIIRKIKQTFGDAPEHQVDLHMIDAQFAAQFHPETAPNAVAEQLSKLDKFTEDEKFALLFQGARLLAVLQDNPKAIEAYQRAAALKPNRLTTQPQIYNLAIAEENPQLVNEITKKIGDIVGKQDSVYKLHEAKRITWLVQQGDLDKGQLTQAMSLITEIKQGRPEWVDAILAEANIYLARNDINGAIESLAQARRFAPSNPMVLRNLARFYELAGQRERAVEMLAEVPVAQRTERDNRAKLAYLAQTEQWDEAKRLTDSTVPPDSEIAQDQMLRSQVYLGAGDLKTAEIAARRAAELEPKSNDVWVYLAQVLAKKGDTAGIEEVIRNVELNLPEQTKPVVLAKCYAAAGDLRNAQQQLLTVLNNDPTDFAAKQQLTLYFIQDRQTENAVKVLQDIINTADTEENRESLFWARRLMASVLASTRSYTNFEKGLELLGQNTIAGTLQNDDLKTWLAMCIERDEPATWQRGVDMLAKVEVKRGLTDDEMFLKAQLLEKYADRWPDVKDITMDLLSRESANEKRLETWVTWLRKHDELGEANRWARNLPANNPTRVVVEMLYLAERGDFATIDSRLKQLVSANLDTPEKLAQAQTASYISDVIAEQYDESFYQLSEQINTRVAQQSSSGVLALAVSMGKQEAKATEALQLCYRAEEQGIPAPLVTEAVRKIVETHRDKLTTTFKEDAQQAEAWVDKMVQKSPENISLRNQAALFYDRIGNLTKVEREYIVTLNSKALGPLDRGKVLNNLAYAMAMQGKTEEPLKMMEEAIKYYGPSPDLLDTRGYIHYVAGNYDKALEDFELATIDGAKNGYKAFHFALALLGQKETDQARIRWAEAIRNGLERADLPTALHTDFDRLQKTFDGQPST